MKITITNRPHSHAKFRVCSLGLAPHIDRAIESASLQAAQPGGMAGRAYRVVVDGVCVWDSRRGYCNGYIPEVNRTA